jgi:hypothetical protein
MKSDMVPPLELIRSGMLMLWCVILALPVLSAVDFAEGGVGCFGCRELSWR